MLYDAMRYLKILSLLACLSVSILKAEIEIRDNGIRNNNLFGIVFGNSSRSFYGKVANINSVSLQEYLSGPYLVTEMVIDMEGGTAQLRIYQTELMDPSAQLPNTGNPALDGARQRISSTPPAPVQKLAEQGRSLHNLTVGEIVVKEYPTATHARTIEFRVSDQAALLELYNAFLDRYTQRNRESGENPRQRGLGGTLFVIR